MAVLWNKLISTSQTSFSRYCASSYDRSIIAWYRGQLLRHYLVPDLVMLWCSTHAKEALDNPAFPGFPTTVGGAEGYQIHQNTRHRRWHGGN